MVIGVVLDASSVAIKEEVTEGTYLAEVAGSEFVQVLEDGLEFIPSKELLEKNDLTSTVEQLAPRVGTKSMAGTIPLNIKAGSAEGDAPEADVLYESLFGGKRQITGNTTTKAGNTSTVMAIEDADIADFAVGDLILVKESAAFEVRPISSLTTGAGTATITFPFALDNGAPADNVVLGKLTQYFYNAGGPTFSATHYIGGTIREKAIGMRSASATLNDWNTGKLANISFACEGLDWEREDGVPLFTPAFDTSETPVILRSCFWIDGVKFDLNNLGLTIENTLGFITSTCSENGKISSRVTDFKVSGTIDPYMDDTAVTQFNKFRDNDSVSLFTYASIPAATGEFDQIVGIWLPQVKFVESNTGDQEGIATDAIAFNAFRNLGNDSIFMGFI